MPTKQKYPYKTMMKFKFPAKKKPTKQSFAQFKKNVVKIEPYKYNDFTLSSGLDTSWFVIANLSNINYDPDATTSDGSRTTNKIKMLNAMLRATITVADSTNILRLAIVRGKRTGSLSAANIQYGTGPAIHAQFNQKYVDVIWDKTYNLQTQDAGSVYPTYKLIDIPTKINKTMKYIEQSAAGAIQPYNNTAYYLVGCSDSSAVPNPTIRGTMRLSFKQLD